MERKEINAPRFYYELDTGKMYIYRYVTKEKGVTRNLARYIETGSLSDNGYLTITFDGKTKYIHRHIWETIYGKIPKGMQIDHINHNKLDNRLCNLRLVTHAENGKNQKLSKNNTSGHIGVYWSKTSGKWKAQIKIQRKMIYIGGFANFEDAVKARKEMDAQYGFHKNHGN